MDSTVYHMTYCILVSVFFLTFCLHGQLLCIVYYLRISGGMMKSRQFVCLDRRVLESIRQQKIRAVLGNPISYSEGRNTSLDTLFYGYNKVKLSGA